jgi:hypothetical protein
VSRRQHRRLLVVAAPAFVAALVVGLIATMALSGSGSASPASTDQSATPAASTPSPAASADTTPSSSHAHSSEPRPPSPPPTTSGGLTASTLPAARTLGVGWVFRVDQGSAEGGYVGNGTPMMARNPHEVVMTAVPLGCEQRSNLPTPSHVLETDYRQRAHGIAGVGLRLRFVSAQAAGRFVSARRADLTACARQPAEPSDFGLRLVSGLHGTGQGTYVSARTDPSLPTAERTWTEVAGWLGGGDVVLLAVNAAPGSTAVDVARLSAAVRGILR